MHPTPTDTDRSAAPPRARISPLLAACIALIALAQGALWWRAAAWYPELPARIPMHFDAAGTPDGWSDKGPMWFLLPIISLVLLAFLGGIALWLGALVRNAPALVNVPRKDLFLKLSPAGRLACWQARPGPVIAPPPNSNYASITPPPSTRYTAKSV